MRELPLQEDVPHSPGMPTEPTSCFRFSSSFCPLSEGQAWAVPFGYPSNLLIALLHQQMRKSSLYPATSPTFWLAASTALLILLSPSSPVPCYLPWAVFPWGSCLLLTHWAASQWDSDFMGLQTPFFSFFAPTCYLFRVVVAWILCPVGCYSPGAAAGQLVRGKQDAGHPAH